jgi:hypothetical protein
VRNLIATANRWVCSLAVTAACALCPPIAQAQEAELDLSIQLTRGDCRQALDRGAAERSISELAEKYSGSQVQIDKMMQSPDNYVSTRVKSARISEGVCRGTVAVKANAEAIRREILATAECDRPVGVLVRLDLEEAGGRRQLATAETVQNAWVNALKDNGLEVVDLTELHEMFVTLSREDCNGHGGETGCQRLSMSFSEGILVALRDIWAGIEHADANNFTSKRLLELKENGVLLAAEFRVASNGRRVTVSVAPKAFDLVSRNLAWPLDNKSPSDMVRQQTEQELLTSILSQLADEIADDVVRQCGRS